MMMTRWQRGSATLVELGCPAPHARTAARSAVVRRHVVLIMRLLGIGPSLILNREPSLAFNLASMLETVEEDQAEAVSQGKSHLER